MSDGDVVEIQITPVAAKIIRDDLKKIKRKRKVHFITSFLGIPVVVDGDVPEDKMWLLNKKER